MALPYQFMALLEDAALAVIWNKNPFQRFILSCGVPVAWASLFTGTKREWLDEILPRLQETEKGRQVLQQMGRNLAEMRSFPNLSGQGDSKRMIRVATEAVGELRRYLREQEEAKADLEREAQHRATAQEVRAANISRRSNIEKVEASLNTLCAEQLGLGEGGFAFERWFYEEFIPHWEVPNRPPHKDKDGRQIVRVP